VGVGAGYILRMALGAEGLASFFEPEAVGLVAALTGDPFVKARVSLRLTVAGGTITRAVSWFAICRVRIMTSGAGASFPVSRMVWFDGSVA
jgi:hypothetical protein